MSALPLSLEAMDALMLPDRPLMEDVVALHHKVSVFQEIDSTNNEAKRRLAEGPLEDGTLFIANTQTAGRGRQGHSFYSPADTGLYLTLVRNAPEVLDPATLSKLTLAAAVATAEAIEESVGVGPKIKWVNDLYYMDKKVCGILTESHGWKEDRPKAVIIGIGVNCTTVQFPEDISETAGSLTTGNIDFIDRNKLAFAMYKRLLYWTEHLADPALLKEYRARSFLTGKEVSFTRNRASYRGIVQDIDDDGRLLVQLTSAIIPESRDQLIALDSGEVTVTGWNSSQN